MGLASPSGSAPFALSVLDNAGTAVGQTVGDALGQVIARAQLADRRGYHRFWMSEHHAMPGAATSSPQLMLARLTGETERIRLGAGGVMLPNHSPLVVAEDFGMLDALAPGRIDLGLGRAPGTDLQTANALRRHRDANDGFPEQVQELLGFMGHDFPEGHPYSDVHAVPGPWQADENGVPRPETSPEVWILGSSPYSARLAGQLGRPYAFALQFGDADVTSAMQLYRDSFRPSAILSEPHTLVSVGVVADDDPEEVRAAPLGLQGKEVLDLYTRVYRNGTPAQVAEALERLHDRSQVDEVMLVTMGHSRESQARTIDLMADHYGMG
ncbi:MAG: LLM class flavin-dependent oxidoreductase [Janibacter sp.]